MEFSKNSKSKDGLQTKCKSCDKAYRNLNKERNKEYQENYKKVNREILLKKQTEHRKKNREKLRARGRLHYKNNKEKAILNVKKWVFKNKTLRNEYAKNYNNQKRSTDIIFKLKEILRRRIADVTKILIQNNTIKAGSAVNDLGCSIEEFRKYLESKFYLKNGNSMSWNNYGGGPQKWQIDHIEALCLFDLSNREEFLKACHYTNLQPLWHEDHVTKTIEDVRKFKENLKYECVA